MTNHESMTAEQFATDLIGWLDARGKIFRETAEKLHQKGVHGFANSALNNAIQADIIKGEVERRLAARGNTK